MANLKDLIVNGSARVIGNLYANLKGLADKATADASGNVITTTYATKTELGNKQDKLPAGTTGYYLQKTASGVAWSEVTSAPPCDGTTISLNTKNELQALGVIDKNTGNPLYDWVGTEAQYNTAYTAGLIKSNWKCFITDDATLGTYLYDLTASISELNYCDGVTAPIQTQLDAKVPVSRRINGMALTQDITIDMFPSQAGHSGQFLTTNGSSVSWATTNPFPTQTGNAGKHLSTNGTSVAWVAPPKITYDSTNKRLTFS